MVRRVAPLALVVQCSLLGLAAAGAEETVPAPDEMPGLSLADGDPWGDLEEDGASEPLRLSMDFVNADLRSVLKSFSQQTGLNIITSDEVSARSVTVYLEDVTVLDALDQILRAGNLTYERPPGSDIYLVRPIEEEPVAAPKPMTRIYRLRYARVSQSVLARAAATFGAQTPFEASITATTAAGGGRGGGSEQVGIDVVIKPLLSPAGQAVVDARTNSLMITDVPENFPRLEAALAALDIRTPQIMVDTEIIETTLSKLKDLGIEWGTGSEGDLISFTPTSRKTRFPFNVFMGEGRHPTDDTPFTASTLDASSFKAVLQALETDTDAKVLARPKVLTLDNESAVIRLTSDETIGFKKTTGEQTATTTSEPERTTTGIVLVVTPQVNEDNYITMIVEPSVTKTVASKVEPPSGQAKPRDPKTRSSRTLVRIRSGDTLVVGGLIDREEQEAVRRVPVLSGIPILGEAFKNTEINTTASELIVFATPHILAEPSAAQVAAAGAPGAWGAAPGGAIPLGAREQEAGGSRQELIEQTLNRLEQPTL